MGPSNDAEFEKGIDELAQGILEVFSMFIFFIALTDFDSLDETKR